jgi:ammonia channel protein AmtB
MFELLATVCAGLFAGAALYISLVQHPAWMESDVAAAAAGFPAVYRRAAIMQAGLAVVGSVSGLIAGLTTSGVIWAFGALLLGFVVPYTLIRIKPVNDRLLAPDADPNAPDVPELMRHWGKLHNVRTGTSLVAFLIFAFN